MRIAPRFLTLSSTVKAVCRDLKANHLAVTYLTGAVAIAGIVDLLVNYLNLPEWFGSVFIGLAFAGAPFVLFERHTRRRRWATGGAAIGILAIFVIFLPLEGEADSAERDDRIRADSLTHAAWDRFGGEPGSSIIQNFNRDRHDLELARRDLVEALALVPESYLAHQRMGVYWTIRGEPDSALEWLNRAIELQPDSARAYSAKGWVLEDLDSLELAHDAYLAGHERAPNAGWILVNIGGTYYPQEPDSAEHWFRRAAEVDTTDFTAHSNLSQVLRLQGRVDEAIISARRAVAADSTVAEPHRVLALALTDAGRLDEALHTIDKAIGLKPDRYHHYVVRGLIRVRLCMLSPAMDDFRRFADLGGVTAEAYDGFLESAESTIAEQDCAGN